MISSLTFYSLLSLVWLFLKIGLIFFGGGYAVIPVMQKELVFNHHLLSMQEFIDGIALSQLTPGPVAILATFAGYRILGVLGAIVSTFAMFLPGTILMFYLSRYYTKIKNSTLMIKILNTITPALIGLIISAAILIGINAREHHIYNFVGFIIAFFLLRRYKINPAVLIFVAGALGIVFRL